MRRVIDLHGHWGLESGFTFFRHKLDEVLGEMDRNGVERMVLSSHRALSFPSGNIEATLPALEASDGRLLGYWVIHPDSTDGLRESVAEFELHRDHFIGFKTHGGMHSCPIDDARYRYALEYADANRLPVLMHTWADNSICGFEQARRVAERYPDMVFLMGHSGFSDYRTFAAIARDNENAYLELCAVYVLNGAIEAMVEIAGSSKIVFGTDLPWFDPAYGIGCVLHSRISDSEKDDILFGNAGRILASVGR